MSAGRREDLSGSVLHNLSRFGLLGVLVLIAVVFSLLKPETFGTWDNFRSILNAQVGVAFLAFAATLPLVVGEFDLSIASVFTLTQILVVGLVLEHSWSVPLAILVSMSAAAVIGLINGIAVSRFGVNSFIVTLASGSIAMGATLAYSEGESIYGEAPAALTSIARNELLGIPLPVVYAALAAIAITLVLSRFPAGRRMYAIGSNKRAAQLTGIRAGRYVVVTFVASACLAGIGGVLLGSELGAASSDTGQALLIPAFAGAFLGATAFAPGRFNIPGALVAVYVVGVAVAGLQQLGVALWVKPVFEGAMLFLAVGLSAWTARLQARLARQARLRELEERSGEQPPRPPAAPPGQPLPESG